MKELTLFILPRCPHCKLALRFHEELFEEHPEYRDIPIRIVDENKEKEFSDQFDYSLVPCYYIGEKQIFQGHAEKEDVERVFKTAMEA